MLNVMWFADASIKLSFSSPKQEGFYNCLTKVGSLEYLDIFTLNRVQNIHFKLPSMHLLTSLFH